MEGKLSPVSSNDDALKLAQARLESMPTDRVPERATPPPGSHFTDIRPNRLFVGRNSELKQLARLLKGQHAVAIGQVAAATGMGGIGKTQLAAEFAYCYGQYFMGGVYWLSFAAAELVPEQVAACGEMKPGLTRAEQVEQVLAEWRSEMPRLLVFDNCEDVRLLVKWLPATGCSRVLVTSRISLWVPDSGVQQLPLDLLERPQSIKLLRGFRKDLKKEDPDLHAIAAELGDLPLALHLTGSYLQAYRYDVTPAQYLQELRQPDLLGHLSMKAGDFSAHRPRPERGQDLCAERGALDR